MIFDALKRFREKTYEQYEKDHAADRPEWMNTVMRIHEESSFLFYFDESDDENTIDMTLRLKGELVKGMAEESDLLRLYSGQGDLLGEGRILSSPEEKEEGRKGLFKRRRQVFYMELVSWKGVACREMGKGQRTKCMRELLYEVSLVAGGS